jgi:hypothetical protein
MSTVTQSTREPKARKTGQPKPQKTGDKGKQAAGWQKLGVYLSPDAFDRLLYHALKRKTDRSAIIDKLVRAELPRYDLVAVPKAPASSPDSATPTDRPGEATDTRPVEINAA